MRVLGPILLSLVVWSACSTPVAPTVPLNRDFTLAPGEIVAVADTAARIHFLGVVNDSRCPADALCIQGGDAIVRIQIQSSGSPTLYELHTGNPRGVAHAGFTIVLVALNPLPSSSRAVQPDDYRATFRVSG